MTPFWSYAGVALTGSVVAAVWPLTPALSSADALQVRLGAVAMAVMACAVVAVVRMARPAFWIAVSIVSAVAGVVMLLVHFNATAGCITDYNGRAVIIGRQFAPDAAEYVAANPGLSSSDLLLDAGGVPDRVWAAASIRSCRLWVSWGGLATIPLFAISGAALVSRGRHRFVQSRRGGAAAVAPVRAGAPTYDAFISYRHSEPDHVHAIELLEALERRGLRVAIDFRDFAANQHFISEMERCIKESRYVLCLITSQYLASDHTSEEAIISKTLDLAERRRRLVPLIFDRVELPVWLHGLVGIDFTPSARVDPMDRLVGLLTSKSAL
ncbi:MAG TPA: toll/interleukin-1 receptor domain-containing protein [Vicinamibacterales bacterium]|nr:toll/interleukin-1 receptor domain-containing protein [Vicinamibacterales bacterium]